LKFYADKLPNIHEYELRLIHSDIIIIMTILQEQQPYLIWRRKFLSCNTEVEI